MCIIIPVPSPSSLSNPETDLPPQASIPGQPVFPAVPHAILRMCIESPSTSGRVPQSRIPHTTSSSLPLWTTSVKLPNSMYSAS